ncbi:MAG: hypothetical protein QG602_3522 [Verrucomicrobiota bacterium]|nr:hypothetical protein [Verrucomicrobiota bacterium]
MLTETAPHVSAGAPGNAHRTFAEIRALDRALALADIAAARQAFTRLQQNSPVIAEALSREPFTVKTRPLKALKVLGHCLLKGNLAGARRAFELFH